MKHAAAAARAALAVAAVGWLIASSRATLAAIDFADPVFHAPMHGVIAVEMADMDGDADVDLLVASIGQVVSLYRNPGNGAFEAPETTEVPGTHLDMAVADFNGDGAGDVALANFGAGTVSVLLNQGDGTFSQALQYPAPGTFFTRGLAAGDVDGDQDADLIVGDAVTSAKAVLLNSGAGAFNQALPFVDGGTTIAVALGDLDGDGDLDCVSTLAGVWLHRNHGDGTFESALNLASDSGTAVVIAALDADDGLDVAVAVSSTMQHHVLVLLNAGDGTSFSTATHPIASLARDIASADIDGDGDTDLATSHVSPVNRVNILANRGDGSYESAIEFFSGIYPQSITAGDIDGDRRPDIITGNEFASPPDVGVLINQTPAPCGPGDANCDGHVNINDLLAVIAAWGTCPSPCPADVNGDGAVNINDLLIVIANWTA